MSDADSLSGMARVPDFTLSQKHFLIGAGRASAEEKAQLMASIENDQLAPYYHYLFHDLKLPDMVWDQPLYDRLAESNKAKETKLLEKIAEVEKEDEGELETVKCWNQLGEFYAKIGDHTKATSTLRKTMELAPSIGSKIDVLLTIVRIGFFFDDKQAVKQVLEETNAMIEKGGDWERKNRYKTYLGVHLLSTRQFKEASKLLTDSLATFTSTELTTYEEIAQYALVAGSISLGRSDIKSKLIDAPEILSLGSGNSALNSVYSLTKSLHSCEYSTFFRYLLETNDQLLLRDKYLSPHANFYMREMRVKAYGQLLESYKALSLKSMSEQFQVSSAFLDEDLCKFIPNKKLNCVMDRVNGVVETNRPDNKNSQYQLLIKNGDALLTKLQKYGAAVRLSGAERVA